MEQDLTVIHFPRLGEDDLSKIIEAQTTFHRERSDVRISCSYNRTATISFPTADDARYFGNLLKQKGLDPEYHAGSYYNLLAESKMGDFERTVHRSFM